MEAKKNVGGRIRKNQNKQIFSLNIDKDILKEFRAVVDEAGLVTGATIERALKVETQKIRNLLDKGEL